MSTLAEQFDAAVTAELARVSHIEYDSNAICTHFAAELRKRLEPSLRSLEAAQKDAARRVELARNEGFREGWMRCGSYHIDVCFESTEEHAEVDRRLSALSGSQP